MNELATQFDKLPPHSIEAEQCALASFMVDHTGEVRRRIYQLIRPEAFFLEDHTIIARRLWAMHEAGRPIDAILLREELANAGELDTIGGTAYLAESLNVVPTAANGVHYATIVRDHAARRWLIRKAHTLLQAGYDATNEPVKIAAALRDSLDPFVARNAPPDDRSGGANELRNRLTGLVDGTIQNVAFPGFPRMSGAGQALLPGSMAILVGVPGDGKTFAILSWLLGWVKAGIPVSVLMCEGVRAWHLTRLLAMVAQDANLLKDDWCRANPQAVSDYEAAYRETMEEVGKAIHVASVNSMTLSDAADWVEAQAETSRIVVVDPLTALDAGNRPWDSDKRFAARTKKAMERHGSSALFVTHPKKGVRVNGLIGLDDIAGGQAYQGFTDFVASLYKHTPRKDVEITKLGYPEQISVNRRIHLNKVRNGIGGGQWIAADFSPSLQWTELGFITREIKRRELSEAI